MKKYILSIFITLILCLTPNQSGTIIATDDIEPNPLTPSSDNGNC